MLSIEVEAFESAEAQRLIAALDAELSANYTADQRFGPNLKPAQLQAGQGVFLVARERGMAVGCGALRLLDRSTAEVKRMFVVPEKRGTGAGRAVLGALLNEARKLGVGRVVLETGVYQVSAIALYEKAGFTRTDCWGEYASARTSVCYEKRLTG